MQDTLQWNGLYPPPPVLLYEIAVTTLQSTGTDSFVYYSLLYSLHTSCGSLH